MPGSILGSTVRRREDPRLVSGRGRYVDDHSAGGGLFAVFARSPLAHARLRSVDLAPARSVPGVVGAFAADDLGLAPRLTFAVLPAVFARPPLATDAVRFVGDAVAVVVAETPAAAADGADAGLRDYEPLPGVPPRGTGASEGAPRPV